MLAFVLGILAIVIALLGFSERGLPLTRRRSLKGWAARAVGVGCLLLGAAFVVEGLTSMHMLVFFRVTARP